MRSAHSQQRDETEARWHSLMHDTADVSHLRAPRPRAAKSFSPGKTAVVRVVLTGGPCAGKSSALSHLTEAATKEGFDVLTAPETATLLHNCGHPFPNPSAPGFVPYKRTFQDSILKLQLALERSMTSLAAKTGRPTILIFDRGLLDCKAYLTAEEWGELVSAQQDPRGSLSEEYMLARYDGCVHLVTAADGAANFYKCGATTDDHGNVVTRLETPEQAIESDRRLVRIWSAHPRHTVVRNEGSFQAKLEAATRAVLEIARETHPIEAELANRRERSSRGGRAPAQSDWPPGSDIYRHFMSA